MKHTYKTKNTCSTKISFDLDSDIVHNIEFTGGCNGNLQIIQKLMDGHTVDKIVAELGGTICGRRPTSCADQLAIAVQKAYKKTKVPKEVEDES